MSDYLAAAVIAYWRELMNRAFEAVKRMMIAGRYHFERKIDNRCHILHTWPSDNLLFPEAKPRLNFNSVCRANGLSNRKCATLIA